MCTYQGICYITRDGPSHSSHRQARGQDGSVVLCREGLSLWCVRAFPSCFLFHPGSHPTDGVHHREGRPFPTQLIDPHANPLGMPSQTGSEACSPSF